jgi:hypothetical protein
MAVLMAEIIHDSLQRSQGRMNKQAKVEDGAGDAGARLFIVKGGVERPPKPSA